MILIRASKQQSKDATAISNFGYAIDTHLFFSVHYVRIHFSQRRPKVHKLIITTTTIKNRVSYQIVLIIVDIILNCDLLEPVTAARHCTDRCLIMVGELLLAHYSNMPSVLYETTTTLGAALMQRNRDSYDVIIVDRRFVDYHGARYSNIINVPSCLCNCHITLIRNSSCVGRVITSFDPPSLTWQSCCTSRVETFFSFFLFTFFLFYQQSILIEAYSRIFSAQLRTQRFLSPINVMSFYFWKRRSHHRVFGVLISIFRLAQRDI